jgi:succinate dehydrogenase hydrophobic anchor subunit
MPQRRSARRDWVIMRVAVIVLVLLAAAFMVIIATNT